MVENGCVHSQPHSLRTLCPQVNTSPSRVSTTVCRLAALTRDTSLPFSASTTLGVGLDWLSLVP